MTTPVTVRWQGTVNGRRVAASAVVRDLRDGWLDVDASVSVNESPSRITCHVDTDSDAVVLLNAWEFGEAYQPLREQVVYLEEAARGIGRTWRPERATEAMR